MTFDPTTSVQIPIACLLTPEAQKARGEDLHDLFAQVDAIDELPAGYTFHFPMLPTIAEQVLAFVLAERACCPFFHFAVRTLPPHDGIWLDLSGAEGVKDVIAQTFLKAGE